MAEESKKQLKDEELEKVSGGDMIVTCPYNGDVVSVSEFNGCDSSSGQQYCRSCRYR